MKITIKLYGMLRGYCPGYHHTQGISANVPDRTTIAKLVSFLDIQLDQNITAIMDGKIQKAEEKDIKRIDYPLWKKNS